MVAVSRGNGQETKENGVGDTKPRVIVLPPRVGDGVGGVFGSGEAGGLC